jgi:glycosyltransferase involved in cell wall biosynthesis
MRIAYIVSRFPLSSETFILRELNAIDGRDGIEIDLRALFPAKRPFVHPDAQPWLERVQRVSALEALSATCWWMLRRPRELARCATTLIRAYRGQWGLLARALTTLPLAAAHARGVQRSKTGHIHAHFATYPAIAAWVCARLTGVTYSITTHAHDIFVDRSMLATLVREASFVATISEFNRSLLAPYATGTGVHVHVVRCGVDPDAYIFRARNMPQTGPIKALCVASLEEYKGHRVLLEALGSGDDELARIQLDLVGAGKLEREVRAQIAQLHLTERVHLLGLKSETEVAALLEGADLFVLPSIVASDGQMEGIPVALMEALAAGVPTIATQLSGIPELVQDEITGVLARPGDPLDLARALHRVLDGEDNATRTRSDAGRNLIEREFDVQRSADTLRQLLLKSTGEAQSTGEAHSHSRSTEDEASDTLRA